MPSRLSKTERPRVGDGAGRQIIIIDGKRLTPRHVVAVAKGSAIVSLGSGGRTRAARAHQTVRRIAERRPVYGQGTGVGANKDTPVQSVDAASHALRLFESHAANVGPEVDPSIARAMMVVRLNQLATGGSGVHPRLLDALVEALNANLTPPLRRYGAIGTGDLTALATTALCIMGEKLWVGGGMRSYAIERTDGMAFMSSSAATLGEAALANNEINRLLQTGVTVAALSHIAMNGSPEQYDAHVHLQHPYPGQKHVAERMRQLLGDDLVRSARHVQDSYGLRALPQVHGAALDASTRLEQVLRVEINAANENPLVSVMADDIYHNGNFHSVYVGLGLDAVRASLYGAASLSVARIGGLQSPSNTGLRPFLAVGPAASSGLLIVEYIAQSALAELRHLANPDSIGSAVLSHGTEEHASFSTQASWHASSMIPAYETILACELVTAIQALRQQNVVPCEDYLCQVYLSAAALVFGESEHSELTELSVTRLTEYLKSL